MKKIIFFWKGLQIVKNNGMLSLQIRIVTVRQAKPESSISFAVVVF